MDIATILFTYNRSFHTNEVIKALAKNEELPQKLYIFQDGLGKEEHRDEWEKVNVLIHKMDFCPTELHISNTNIGVAQSIVSGINYVLDKHEAVVVLEDDCVPSVSFGTYMKQCLEKYKDNPRVWCVGGFNDPVKLDRDEYDVYGCGRTSSWGWGTWRDRWKKFDFDHGVLKRLKNDEVKSVNLATWGNDCEQMILEHIAGRSDVWDAYWSLQMIEDNGICVLPYETLVRNIGLDGSGVHCGMSDRFKVEASSERKTKFALPDNINILQDTKKAYVSLYGNYTAVNVENTQKESIIIYGMGKFFRQKEREINEQYYIRAFIDRREKGWYAGKKIISLNELTKYENEKVLIMVQNVQECFRIVKELIQRGVNAERILIGHNQFGIYGEKIDKISVLADGGLLLTFGNIDIKVKSKEEFDRAFKIVGTQLYNYYINSDKKEVILDVGTHASASALYFFNRNNVEKLYVYELSDEAFASTYDNLQGCLENPYKLELFQYEDSISDVLKDIASKYHECNFVLKIDCNDRGKNILKEIIQSKVLKSVSLLMLEWHDNMLEDNMQEFLIAEGFCWKSIKDNGANLLYAYKNGKTKR